MAGGIEEVRGRKVVIRFDGAKCVHSRNCVLGRPDVFVPNAKGAWIHPDRAAPEEIAALVASCPSGALTYERLDGGSDEAPPRVNTVRVRENGPLAFHAPLRIGGADGGGVRATLCRCGASKRKPFCDGSHAAAGFVATGEPVTNDLQPLPVRDGVLEIAPQPDGPLHVRGPLEIISGTGRTILRTAETWLCRCGTSKNKPYCDGSHKAASFRDSCRGEAR
jgi:CDGSH-type Zn-finger protein/uncharacterized Fe-S cluster protein YjdI